MSRAAMRFLTISFIRDPGKPPEVNLLLAYESGKVRTVPLTRDELLQVVYQSVGCLKLLNEHYKRQGSG